MFALKSVIFLPLCTLIAIIHHHVSTGQLVRAKLEKDPELDIEVCGQGTECVAGPKYCHIYSESEQLQKCGAAHEPSNSFCCPFDKVIRPKRAKCADFKIDLSVFDDVMEMSGSVEPFKEEPECGNNNRITSIHHSINFTSNATFLKNDKSRDWPWVAVFLEKTNYNNFCGGVLLNRRYVLTAAHCFYRRYQKKDFVVRLGEYDFRFNNDTKHVDHEVSAIRNHPDYDPRTHANDISLIKLRRLAEYSPFVWPICLPKRNMQVYSRMAIVAGWGQTTFGGALSDVLSEATIPIWDHEKCVKAFSQPIFKTNLCAAAYEGGKDSCLGDSGSPLMLRRRDGKWTNVGVVSWGVGCGEAEHPGVYTKVTSYLRWIAENTQDHN